jgi:hypothetical protein
MPVEIMDRKRRFQRLDVTPFEVVPTPGLPWTNYGQEWCAPCDQVVDVQTLAVSKGGLYLYKRICRRCGKVLMRGIYEKNQGTLPNVAHEWINETGKDRSK